MAPVRRMIHELGRGDTITHGRSRYLSGEMDAHALDVFVGDVLRLAPAGGPS
jgi:hypothetical protein